MKVKSLLKNTDMRNMLKIVRISEKMIKTGKKYVPSSSDFNDILLIMNGYINLYGRVGEYERNQESK